MRKDKNKIETIVEFFIVGQNYINSQKKGESKLRSLIGKDLIKKRGKYWYWGFPKINTMEVKELRSIILKIERNTPPFVSDDFQVGYDGAYENK